MSLAEEREQYFIRQAAKLGISPEEYRAKYEQALAEWHKRLAPEIEAIERSERLTAADYSVYINTRDE